jgi:hypothetical protein
MVRITMSETIHGFRNRGEPAFEGSVKDCGDLAEVDSAWGRCGTSQEHCQPQCQRFLLSHSCAVKITLPVTTCLYYNWKVGVYLY